MLKIAGKQVNYVRSRHEIHEGDKGERVHKRYNTTRYLIRSCPSYLFFFLASSLPPPPPPPDIPLLTAPAASLKPCCSAHLPSGAAALSASAPTVTVTLAAVVTPTEAALPAGRGGSRGERGG